VFAAQGVVTEEARGMFARIRAIDPADPLPRFWLAMAKEQDGKGAEAVADYREMLASAPADAGWRPLVEERLKALREAGVMPAGTEPPASSSSMRPRGPSEADVAAAQQMKTEDRAAMINQMVAGLAARLEKDGKDLAGWQRLVRAYVVLGRKADAASALESARRNFAGDEAALAELAQTAKSLGIGS
jgi:cytochrome c-type biogenesis protein CcmH